MECELSAPAKDSCLFWHLHSFGFFPLVNQATLYQHSWHVRVLHTDISRRKAACEIVGSSSKEPSQRSKVGKIDQWKVHTLLTSSSATLRILTPFWKAQMAQEHGRGRFFFFFFAPRETEWNLTSGSSESESDSVLPKKKKKNDKPVSWLVSGKIQNAAVWRYAALRLMANE